MARKSARAIALRLGKFVDSCVECVCSDEKLMAVIIFEMIAGIASELRRLRA